MNHLIRQAGVGLGSLGHPHPVCCFLAFLCFCFGFDDCWASIVAGVMVFGYATNGAVFGMVFKDALLVAASDEAFVFVCWVG